MQSCDKNSEANFYLWVSEKKGRLFWSQTLSKRDLQGNKIRNQAKISHVVQCHCLLDMLAAKHTMWRGLKQDLNVFLTCLCCYSYNEVRIRNPVIVNAGNDPDNQVSYFFKFFHNTLITQTVRLDRWYFCSGYCFPFLLIT